MFCLLPTKNVYTKHKSIGEERLAINMVGISVFLLRR